MPHRKHKKVSLEAAKDKYRPDLVAISSRMSDLAGSHQTLIHAAQQEIHRLQQQKLQSIQGINIQKFALIKIVNDYADQLAQDVTNIANVETQKLLSLITALEGERFHLAECRDVVDTCVTRGSAVEVVKTTLEDKARFERTLQEMDKEHDVVQLNVMVECPPATLGPDIVGTIKCSLAGGESVTVRTTDVETPELVLSVMKLRQFEVPFKPISVCCTARGYISVSNGSMISVYTSDGTKEADLAVPDKFIIWDMTCINNTLYACCRNTNSFLTYNGSSCKLVRINTRHSIRGIAGISAMGEDLLILDSFHGRMHHIRRFASCWGSLRHLPMPVVTDIELKHACLVYAGPDSIALCCVFEDCVHVLDFDGKLTFTYGTPGHRGRGQGQLNRPVDAVIDSNNNLLIADCGNSRVCIVSGQGSYLGHIDLEVDNLGWPLDLTLTPEGHLLVACEEPRCIATYKYSFANSQ